MASSSINRKRITANVLIQIATLFVIVVMVNYLAFNHYRRWDFSRDQKYTLSEQTRRLLEDLKKPVKLIVFFSGASDISFDTMALTKEYENASKKKVSVEVVNPYMSLTRAREIAAKYKLGDQENVVIVDYDGRSKFVSAALMAEYDPSLNPLEKPRLKAFKGEQALTSALIEVTEQGTNTLYALSGHGEPALDGEGFTVLKTFVERQNIKIEPLNLADGAIPAEAKMLFILGPKYDFSDRDLDLLRAYWEKKGRIFVFLDPATPTPKLAAFLSELGVTPNDDRVLKTVPLGRLTGVLKEITGDFANDSPITRRLQNVNAMFLGGTQSLTLDSEAVKEANIKLQPLIRASQGFWAETRHDVNTSGGIYFDANEDKATPVVAASIEKGALDDQRVQVDSSRLIVVGNSAFLANEAMTEADLDFVLSGLNWLLDRESLIGIAPKAVRNFSLSLTESQLGTLALLTMVAIPGAAALAGFISWLKRRR